MFFSITRTTQFVIFAYLLLSASSAMALEVSTCEALDEAINVVRATDIELTNDIECRDHKFMPAGITFTGRFNGNGYAINNLQFVRGQSSNAGLFELVNNATIENLIIKSPIIGEGFSSISLFGWIMASKIHAVSVEDFKVNPETSTFSTLGLMVKDSEFDNIVINNLTVDFNAHGSSGLINSGAVVGTADNVSFNDITVNADFNAIDFYSWYVGGVVGQGNNVKITNSNVIVYMGSETDGDAIGGIAGKIEGNNLIENVHVKGEVYGNNETGGLVGDATYSDDTKIYTSSFDGKLMGHQNAGGLVGKIGNATIMGSYASGFVDGRLGVGGLIGDAWTNTTISKSYSNNTINSYGTLGGRVGGLSGEVGYDIIIDQSYSSSTIYSESNSSIGGLIGYTSYSKMMISDSFFDGRVSGVSGIGGLLGVIDSEGPITIIRPITITNNYVVGAISGSSAGGLVGISGAYIVVENSYWDINTTGQETSARDVGEGKTTAEMLDQVTYVGWDFDTIWQPINPEQPDYPQLRYFSKES